MPPPGGFGSISVERTFAKPIIRQGVYALILIGMTVNGYLYYRGWRKKYAVLKCEQTEHYVATTPFLYAEQERKFLRQLRVNREEERELMKDHPGWQLGTLYGEPVFKTIPKNQIPPINAADFVAHRSENEFQWKVKTCDFHT